MVASSFDSTHAVRFDLPRGSVRTKGDDDRVLLVPMAALDDLVLSASPEAVDAFGRALGGAIGRRAAARMSDPHRATAEEFVAQLAGETAIAGVGALAAERWGRALVVVVEDSPLVGTLLVAIVASAIDAASGRRTGCTLLSRDDRVARILVTGERAVGRVREWIASGVGWSEALAKLQGGAT